MGGQTELERTLLRLKHQLNAFLGWWNTRVRPLLRFREIRGVLIGQHFGPLTGARVTLNGWRSVVTDARGEFRFRLVMKPHSTLTVEWHEAELLDWIKIAPHKRVTELKLKWPLLIRGQVVDPNGEPVKQLKVQLNEQWETHTDAHGTFIFPQQIEEEGDSKHLLFTYGDQSFLHHFRSNPQEHMLHRFLLDPERGLYHLEDHPRGQAVTPSLNRFSRQVKWSTMSIALILGLLFLTLSSNADLNTAEAVSERDEAQAVSAQGDKEKRSASVAAPRSKWDRVGVLERSVDQQTEPRDQSRPPLWDDANQPREIQQRMKSGAERDASATIEELPDEERPLCSDMEFSYLSYIVPKGMEGILLSIVFGRWQSWRGELSAFNGLDSQHQLQAGQRVKLKLPLRSWTLYQHEDQASWRKVLARGDCLDREVERVCTQLLQSWNPHLRVSRLKRGDRLLINLQLLRDRPFEGTTLTRIEKLRRSPSRRRRKPRLKVDSRCALAPTLSSELESEP